MSKRTKRCDGCQIYKEYKHFRKRIKYRRSIICEECETKYYICPKCNSEACLKGNEQGNKCQAIIDFKTCYLCKNGMDFIEFMNRGKLGLCKKCFNSMEDKICKICTNRVDIMNLNSFSNNDKKYDFECQDCDRRQSEANYTDYSDRGFNNYGPIYFN
jgi:hypothetical protein